MVPSKSISAKTESLFGLTFPEFIQHFYVEGGLTMKAVARLIDSHAALICKEMKKFGVKAEQYVSCEICENKFLKKSTRGKYCESEDCRKKVSSDKWGKSKPSHRKARRKRGLERKEKLIQILGGECGCGESDLYKLSFHHRNPEDKSFTLDQTNLYKKSWEIIEEEVKKCDLLCLNCHAILHEKARDSSRVFKEKYKRGRELKLILIKQFGGMCSDCGFESDFTQCMSFDHREPEDKSFELNTTSLQKKDLTSILEEAKKCDLLCLNCHISKNKDR